MSSNDFRRVSEELHTVGGQRQAIDQRASIDDAVATVFDGQIPFSETLGQLPWARENLDAVSGCEPVPGFCADSPRIAGKVCFRDSLGRNPHLADLGAVAPLQKGRVIEPEEVSSAADMVCIQMRKRDEPEILPVRFVHQGHDVFKLISNPRQVYSENIPFAADFGS
jgi:hypothetical protein